MCFEGIQKRWVTKRRKYHQAFSHNMHRRFPWGNRVASSLACAILPTTHHRRSCCVSSDQGVPPSPATTTTTSCVQRSEHDHIASAIFNDDALLRRLASALKARCDGDNDAVHGEAKESCPTGSRGSGLPQSVLRATVKIFASSSLPNCIMPWQKRQQISVSGSGFVIDLQRRMIITNAHVVQGAQFVEVRKHGDSNNHTGYVVFMGADCDMALVHVPDDKFWDEQALTALPFDVPHVESTIPATAVPATSTSPLEELAAMHTQYAPFTGLPQLQDGVKVVGYPVGGDQLSITSGVVSRIEVSSYGRDTPSALLTVQIDAAINHGNSGGPALSTRSKKVIGIAFQVLGNAESIGYIIPLPIVASFLHGYLTVCRHGGGGAESNTATSATTAAPQQQQQQQQSAISERNYYPHAPTLGLFFQLLQNKHLRAHYGLKPHQTGVLISGTAFRSPAEGILRPDDVIVALNGLPVENDGTVEFRPHERVVFTHVVHVCPPGQSVVLRVLRKVKPAEAASVADTATNAASSRVVSDDGVVQELEVTLSPRPLNNLVRHNLHTMEFRERPKYCVFGGLVFSTLTQPLLAEWGDQWYNTAPRWLSEQLSANCTADRDEVVVVVQVMPHPVNQSYESMYGRIVTQVNDVDVRNFAHFRGLVKQLRDQAVQRAAAEPTIAGGADPSPASPSASEANLILHTRALGDLTKVAVLPIAAAIEADRELEHIYEIPPQRWE